MRPRKHRVNMNINFFHKYVVCFKCCKQKIENMVNESVCTVLIKKIFCWTKTKLKLHLINSKEKSENFSSVNKILREEVEVPRKIIFVTIIVQQFSY